MRAVVLAGVLGLVGTPAVGQTADATPPAVRRVEDARPVERARIPHLDGSGRATVVDIDPGVPGAKDFVEGATGPVPRRGELILPPKATPEPSPARRVD